MKSTNRLISRREASLISPPGRENKQLKLFHEELSGSKAKKRGASNGVHARWRNDSLIANFILMIKPIIIIRIGCTIGGALYRA